MAIRLLAFSGRKQSGKDTAARFIKANADLFFGFEPVFHLCYFGGPMKDFATDYLGVEHHKVWGTDKDKNELTHISWRQLPHYEKYCRQLKEYNTAVHVRFEKSGQEWSDEWYKQLNPIPKPDDFLTGRQLLQQIGEEMFLDMNPHIWTNRFELDVRYQMDEAKHRDPEPHIFVVADPRKPEQIDTVHRLGGKVIRFLRDPYEGTDRHISETALDPDVYDQGNFDAVIDNRQWTIEETHKRVLMWLRRWDWVATHRIDLNKVVWNPPE